MTLSMTMEEYLSLITLFIMCIPGAVFLIHAWRKRMARKIQKSKTTPLYGQGIPPGITSSDAIFRPPAALHHATQARLGQTVAYPGPASRPRPHIDCIELVSTQLNPLNSLLRWIANTLVTHCQDTGVSLPQIAHTRPGR